MNANNKGSDDPQHNIVFKDWLRSQVKKKLCEREIIFKYAKNSDEEEKWFKLLDKFSNFGNITSGNLIRIFDNSSDIYNEMLKSIDLAKERVWFETYIFEDCKIGEKFIDSLCRASNRGCEVILLLDSFGSYKFPKKWENMLKENSVKFIWFNPISIFNIHTILFRNHRKILITDNKSYCGSINITDRINNLNNFEEANMCELLKVGGISRKKFLPLLYDLLKLPVPTNLKRTCFYDVHAEIIGPATYDLGEVFLDSIKESKCSIFPRRLERPNEEKNGTILQVLSSNTRNNQRGIQNVLGIATSSSSISINLTTSYFFPPRFLYNAIQAAINNNVRVSLLLSGKSDILGDTSATKYLVKQFFRNNTHFFFTKNIHCHAKYISIDGIWSSLGSFNWDGLSFKRNLEVSVASFDPVVAKQLLRIQEKLTGCCNSTEEQTIMKWNEQSSIKKFYSKLAYYIIRYFNKRL
ncbi:phosphatidylserine phosphatidylglycerophosphate cardiolipin synthase [Cryptosporidium bovis]|uniref:phosphatidylserine phosphatidylglycerophosphate cardiolipin synthase n=1 Tax=Cryptosporidium bovis TaxID=310047 RepID=UPI00351A1B9A|nr:phosphatidylserine phosphatidylglycerophosphate cardiolipin synthase [Cryptosporidium bovis]